MPPKPKLKTAQINIFSMQQQLESEWCWAAVAQAIKTFFSPTAEAHPVQDRSTGTHRGTIHRRSHELLRESRPHAMCATLQDALNVTQNLNKIVDSSVPFDQVKSELTDGHPIGVRIQWSNGQAHFIAIDGYREFSSGAQQVLVADPLMPNGSASYIYYEDLVDFYDQDGAWSATFLVHP